MKKRIQKTEVIYDRGIAIGFDKTDITIYQRKGKEVMRINHGDSAYHKKYKHCSICKKRKV